MDEAALHREHQLERTDEQWACPRTQPEGWLLQ
jgi:hypothetical protein